jgi:hypothetical protein
VSGKNAIVPEIPMPSTPPRATEMKSNSNKESKYEFAWVHVKNSLLCGAWVALNFWRFRASSHNKTRILTNWNLLIDGTVSDYSKGKWRFDSSFSVFIALFRMNLWRYLIRCFQLADINLVRILMAPSVRTHKPPRFNRVKTQSLLLEMFHHVPYTQALHTFA